MEVKNSETLLDYANKLRTSDPFWEEVARIIEGVMAKARSVPVHRTLVIEPSEPTLNVGDHQAAATIECPARSGNVTKKKCECIVCGTVFFAKRADAVYCGDRCRAKGCRRGLAHRGSNVTIRPVLAT